jgi:hypothetical protein
MSPMKAINEYRIYKLTQQNQKYEIFFSRIEHFSQDQSPKYDKKRNPKQPSFPYVASIQRMGSNSRVKLVVAGTNAKESVSGAEYIDELALGFETF